MWHPFKCKLRFFVVEGPGVGVSKESKAASADHKSRNVHCLERSKVTLSSPDLLSFPSWIPITCHNAVQGHFEHCL